MSISKALNKFQVEKHFNFVQTCTKKQLRSLSKKLLDGIKEDAPR